MAPDTDVELIARTASFKRLNPLQRAIALFASDHQPGHVGQVLTQRDIPKRFTRYGSLLLLGPTFLTHTSEWVKWYDSLSHQERDVLFRDIANGFPGSVTHIAANAPIASTTASSSHRKEFEDMSVENVMRSPTGFLPLHGEFGPGQISSRSSKPSAQDFDQAYWVEAVQLKGIVQIWAPRWTMFSRGNISEKARILGDKSDTSPFFGLSTGDLVEDACNADVVDFFVGIGYFAFCYLWKGVRRVWGWDINGWSIEGLRRGCLRNGWNVIVVGITSDGNFEDARGATGLVHEIVKSRLEGNEIRCVAFWGDNTWASKIMKEIVDAFSCQSMMDGVDVRHCNLGLLPTARNSWEGALSVLGPRGGWLHVHENVETHGIEQRATEISDQLQIHSSYTFKDEWAVVCEHVENVKTYAPGVMHCVFDIKVCPRST